MFVGSQGGLEVELVPKEGYTLETLPVKGFKRKVSLEFFSAILQLIRSFFSSLLLLQKHQPNAVVGMGGYASFPLVMVASLLGYPTIIHEQNMIPGLANKILSRRVALVTLSFRESEEFFPKAREKVLVGNPIRTQVLQAEKSSSLGKFKLETGRKTLLVFGGSRGAKKINQALLEAYSLYSHLDTLQILHLTGMMEYQAVARDLEARKSASDRVIYRCYPYLDDISPAYAVADLVISRAGATTIAELTARGLPAILVPYPFATNNHQKQNAEVLVRAGGARIISDQEINASLLWQTIASVIFDHHILKELSRNSLRMGRPDAAENLAQLVLKMEREENKSQM